MLKIVAGTNVFCRDHIFGVARQLGQVETILFSWHSVTEHLKIVRYIVDL